MDFPTWFLFCSWSQLLETLPLPNVSIVILSYSLPSYTWIIPAHLILNFREYTMFNRIHCLFIQIKWICPTAPSRPVALFGGFPCTACKIYCCDLLSCWKPPSNSKVVVSFIIWILIAWESYPITRILFVLYFLFSYKSIKLRINCSSDS